MKGTINGIEAFCHDGRPRGHATPIYFNRADHGKISAKEDVIICLSWRPQTSSQHQTGAGLSNMALKNRYDTVGTYGTYVRCDYITSTVWTYEPF